MTDRNTKGVFTMQGDRYINPFTDFGFKRLFGEEPNNDLLLDFLSELLRKEKGNIREITYLKNEHLPYIGERRAVFDIYCENEKGEKFIVEIQKAKQNFFKDRSIFYATFPIQEQAVRGDWNFELRAVYTVGILDFVFDDADKEKTVVSEVRLMDTEKKTVFYDKLTFIYLQMPNFVKTENELETHFDKWLYVIRNLSSLSERPAKLQERVFEKLFEIAEIAQFSREERMAYEDSLKHYRDLKNSIDTARAEGKAEGRAEGRAEGEKIGIEKGKKEMARALLGAGLMSPEQISKISGLDLEEIRLLKQKK
jgi:predicted transposase/invertase (TIGR01784 family)